APSLEIWSPCRSVTRSGWPCAVDQTAWTMFPRSNRPVENASCRRTESAAKPVTHAATPAASTARADGSRILTRRPPGPAAGACSIRSQQPLDDAAPARAEDGFACTLLVRGATRGREALPELSVCGQPAQDRKSTRLNSSHQII